MDELAQPPLSDKHTACRLATMCTVPGAQCDLHTASVWLSPFPRCCNSGHPSRTRLARPHIGDCGSFRLVLRADALIMSSAGTCFSFEFVHPVYSRLVFLHDSIFHSNNLFHD